MKFVSYQFIIFLVVVWTAFLIAKPRFRWLLLLAASYVFYAMWSIPFIAVILLTTSIDYGASRIIHKSSSKTTRKTALWTAILANLLVLAIFKYFNFFIDCGCSLFAIIGTASPLPKHLNILLPLGISYYTFEAISYLVDVYKGAAPAPTWWTYNFYIMYFPHLVAGPIVRFKELWAQYRAPIQNPSAERIFKGIELLLFGYLFKLAIADSCATVADPVFAAPAQASTLMIYIASLAFGAQLYMDFLGYTQIARGASLLFNIELPANFNNPLHAANMADFFVRWQITLSKWLYDYVYRPLGGSRKSLWKTMLNVFVTLLIAGVWHGAGVTYVVLGLFFGCCVALYHAYRRVRKAALKQYDRQFIENPVYKRVTHLLTFILIVISGILFRSPNLQTDGIFLSRLARLDEFAADVVHQISIGDWTPIALFLLMPAITLAGPVVVKLYQRLFNPMPYWFKVQTATAAVTLCWIMSGSETPPFIYFQF